MSHRVFKALFIYSPGSTKIFILGLFKKRKIGTSVFFLILEHIPERKGIIVAPVVLRVDFLSSIVGVWTKVIDRSSIMNSITVISIGGELGSFWLISIFFPATIIAVDEISIALVNWMCASFSISYSIALSSFFVIFDILEGTWARTCKISELI